MRQVSSSITISAPANAIWPVISDFGVPGQYLFGLHYRPVQGQIDTGYQKLHRFALQLLTSG